MNKVRSIDEQIKTNLIVEVLSGSRAYGMNTAESDYDYRGIFCEDRINVITPFFPMGQKIEDENADRVIYALSKFMKLYTEANPNILELLWVDESDVLTSSTEYGMLRQHRQALLSSKLAFTFTGYAAAQIKRIRGHNRWISYPHGETPPHQSDYVTLVYNFTQDKIFKIRLSDYKHDHCLKHFDGNLYGLYQMAGERTCNEDHSLKEYDSDTEKVPMFIVKFNKQEFNGALEDYQNYWRWKNNRNEKRSALEEQYGYDCKHASHCVRLLRTGLEALQTGQINVKRSDAQELLAIRNGAWTYEQLLEYAEYMDHEVREVWYHKTALPKKPDIKLAASLLVDIQQHFWDTNT